MTLLLSCLTPDYIINVSDRRLTRPDGKVVDDDANKAIFFSPSAVFTYTGIANIGKLRTDEWIAEQLIGRVGIQSAIENLTLALNNRIRNLPHPYRHLAIVIDCWGSTANDSAYKPYSCAITNFIDANERRVVAKPFNSFNTFIQTLPAGNRYAFLPLGQNMPSRIVNSLFRNVKRAEQHIGATRILSPSVVGRLMIQAVREVADGNIRVGSNLMLTVLPNHANEEFANLPNSFAYIGADNTPVLYAPITVTPSLAIKGFKMYPGPPRFTTKVE